MSGAVLFIATVECLTMAMRWCYVLPANVGFTVSAKWVILTIHNGGTNRAKMSSKGSKRRKLKGKKNEGKVQQLRRVAANYPVESKRVQELYTAIAGIYEDFPFPDGKTHIGCMSAEDHASVTKDTTRKLGCTHYLHTPKYDFFIVIFHEELETDASFLSVVIHEMAHGEQGAISTSQQPHGKLFKKIGKRLIQCVKSKQAELPKPYSNVEINEVTVLTAKC